MKKSGKISQFRLMVLLAAAVPQAAPLILVIVTLLAPQAASAADAEVFENGKAPPEPGLITRLRRQEEARKTQAEYDVHVAIPDIDTAEKELEGLNNTVSNALHMAQQNRQAEESSHGLFESVVIAAALLGGGIFFFRKFGPRIEFLFKERSQESDATSNLAEEKSFTDFVAAFKIGPPPRHSAPKTASEVAAEAAIGALPEVLVTESPLKAFFESTPATIGFLRGHIQEITRASDHASRQKLLAELGNKIRDLKGVAGLPEVLPVWQLSAALEGLVRQLSDKVRNVTPSTLRTVASAVDLLEALSAPGVRPDLMSNPPIRLLAVDDDALSRHAVSFALKKALNKPDLAENGEAAMALVSHIHYDAIFLDVQMPGMNGFETCTKIHGTELNHTTPVVFVTCQSDFDARAKSILSGGIDLIGKPFLTFEITVKALTLALRGRLKSKATKTVPPDKQTTPSKDQIEVPLVIEKVDRNAGSQPNAQSSSPASLRLPSEGSSLESSIENAHSASLHKSREERRRNRRKIAQLRQSKKDGRRRRDRTTRKHHENSLSTDSFNISSDAVANAFFAHAPANIEMLQDRVEHIYEATDDAFRQEIIVELYLAVHSLAAEASLAKLDTISQLSSFVEALLKKFLEDGSDPTVASLSIAANAFELIHDLCDAKFTAKLAEQPLNILLAADDPFARKDLQDAIQLPSAQIESVETSHALKLVAEKQFDVVLVLVQNPSSEILAACSALRQNSIAKTPIIFVSDEAHSEVLLESIQSGGTLWLPNSSLLAEVTLAALTSALASRFDRLTPPDELERGTPVEELASSQK